MRGKKSDSIYATVIVEYSLVSPFSRTFYESNVPFGKTARCRSTREDTRGLDVKS